MPRPGATEPARPVQIINPLAYSTGRLLGRVECADRRVIVGVLVACTWLVGAVVAVSVPHNGWLYGTASGNAATYWSTSLALTHAATPNPAVPYGLPVAYWPLALVFGANPLTALPVIVVAQVVVLGALAVIGVFAIAERIGGRLFASAATVMWVVSPLVAVAFIAYPWSRPMFKTDAAPGLVGLTSVGDYPSMVGAILVVWLVLRAIERRADNDAVLAGLLCGFLIALDTGNGFLAPVPVIALLATARWRQAGMFALALLPALLTLLLWRATATSLSSALHDPLGHFLSFRWSAFTTNLVWLRKEGWSLRVAEWVIVAGMIGALRRGLAIGALLGLWGIAYLVLEGGTPAASIRDMTYFNTALPGFPAYVILAACIVFLLPGLARRTHHGGGRSLALRPTPVTIAAAVLLAGYPLALVATARGRPDARLALGAGGALVPVSATFDVAVQASDGVARLRWRPLGGSTRVWYDVYRAVGSGCSVAATVRECDLSMALAAVVRRPDWTGRSPASDDYRIGVVAGPDRSSATGSLLMVSTPARASS